MNSTQQVYPLAPHIRDPANGGFSYASPGIDVRTLAILMAMQGLVASAVDTVDPDAIAIAAVRIADAVMVRG